MIDHMQARRRGGSFHHEEGGEEKDVQFVTPYYEGHGPEPLDLSKLRLENMGPEDNDSSDDEEDEEELYTRGRSRSRSVHANDQDGSAYMVNDDEGYSGPPEPQSELSDDTSKNGAGKAERTGPLQHREVVALQKGLEEATLSLNPNASREDEEERMAADAEKRTRLLAASHINTSNSNADAARRVKLLLLGDSGVGKSSLIVRWTHDTFSPSLVSTVGVNFKNKKVTYHGETLQVQVWDTAGQEQFHKITTSYYKGAQGIMLVYDVSDEKSLANVEYWIKNIKANASDSVHVVLVGNKIDLRGGSDSRCIDTQRGKEISHKFGVPFFETSAKDSSNVDNSFMTLVGHIADATSPTRNQPPRAVLQGGLERKASGQESKLVDPVTPASSPAVIKPSAISVPKVGIPKPSGTESLGTGRSSPGGDHKEKCTVC